MPEGLVEDGKGGVRVIKYRVTPKVKAFFEAYGGVAKLNGADAARAAGFRHPSQSASVLKEKFPEEVARVEEEYWSKFRVSDQELDQIISEIARDLNHKDRLKAAELIARMKGKLNDKVTVTVDRKTTLKELDEILVYMKALAVSGKSLPAPAIVDSQVVSSSPSEDPNQR